MVAGAHQEFGVERVHDEGTQLRCVGQAVCTGKACLHELQQTFVGRPWQLMHGSGPEDALGHDVHSKKGFQANCETGCQA